MRTSKGSIASVCLLLVVLISGCGGSSGDAPSGGDTLEDDAPETTNPQFGSRSTTATDASGLATTSFAGREADVVVTDLDSDGPVPDVAVNTLELVDGTFVWTDSASGDYFPATAFVPLGAEGEIQPRTAVVILRVVVVAVDSVGSAVHEYLLDPPGVESLSEENGILRDCVSGDLSDVLGVSGFANVTTLIVRVVGTPADVRGVEAIYTAFTRTRTSGDVGVDAFEEAMGIRGSDTQTLCWPVVDGIPLPVVEATVERETSSFDIDSISSLDWYPPFPLNETPTTSVSVSWSGSAQFPVRLVLVNDTCFVGVRCTGGSQSYDEESNPLVLPFGCVSNFPDTRSGFTRWTVRLIDSAGQESPPGTFLARCGQPPTDPFSSMKLIVR